MLKFLFLCLNCGGGLTNLKTFPLCQMCLLSLVTCPALCVECASPQCPTSGASRCLFPWRKQAGIHSYSARYLLVGESYLLLRKWKKQSGWFFDRRILKPDAALLDVWRSFCPDAIIPVPQRLSRAWQMRGSRAEQIAHWVRLQTGAPIVQALGPVRQRRRRQAELGLHGRLENLVSFEWRLKSLSSSQINRVILVDDFMTTGKTLRAATNVLAKNTKMEVHIFCLGIRPLKIQINKN